VNINKLHGDACRGDRQAAEELFEVISSRFRLFTHHKIRNKTDAEEIVQEALMTIYAEYNKITFRTSFFAWALKVLDNRILNYLRKKKRESQRFGPEINWNQESLDKSIETDPDLKRQLLLCLQKICQRNIRYARILNLHYQGYKTDEICNRMNIKPETLYSALSKARSMLEGCLEKGDVT
jgi:RNA polymerase sigma-70 factor (ECF subfamily)